VISADPRELGYDLDRGEPPGRWHGRGAAALGLDGTVDEDDFLAVGGPASRQLRGMPASRMTANAGLGR
jgi:hypothetical protein